MSTRDESTPFDDPVAPAPNPPRLDRLTDAERDVYVSVDLEGLRPVELARYGPRSESTVRTLLSRARQKVGESQ